MAQRVSIGQSNTTLGEVKCEGVCEIVVSKSKTFGLKWKKKYMQVMEYEGTVTMEIYEKKDLKKHFGSLDLTEVRALKTIFEKGACRKNLRVEWHSPDKSPWRALGADYPQKFSIHDAEVRRELITILQSHNMRTFRRDSLDEEPRSTPTGKQIFVKTPKGKTIALHYHEGATIQNVKDNIQKKVGLETEEMTLIYWPCTSAHITLQDHRSLSCYDMKPETTLTLTMTDSLSLSQTRSEDVVYSPQSA